MRFQNYRKKALATAAVSALSAFSLSLPAHATPSDILFILDGSGSMWGQIDAKAKIETAKTTMASLLDSTPSDARIGLMTYGTTSKKSCTDVTVLNPVGADRSAIKQSVAGLTPLGKTPIDLALAMGVKTLADTEPADTQKSVVLISDGIETCDGDPCSVAGLAKSTGVAMKVHVVGFDVDQDARAQLECIANAGGGQYFNASDTDGFEQAMQAVVQVAQAKAPKAGKQPAPAPAPVATPFFVDEFDGEDLGEHWSMTNPNEDNYIVEDGSLLMVASRKQGFRAKDPQNLLKFSPKMPKGDWDMKATVNFDAQTGRDNLWFGLFKDAKNFIAIQHYYKSGNPCSLVQTRLHKFSKGEKTKFDATVAGSKACGWGKDGVKEAVAAQAETGVVLTLSKRGRKYFASSSLVGSDAVYTTEPMTSLRLPGQPAFAIGKFDNADGEVVNLFDRFEIIEIGK